MSGAPVDDVVEQISFVAHGLESPRGGFHSLAAHRIDAGHRGLLAVTNGNLPGLSHVQVESPHTKEAADSVADASRNFYFALREHCVLNHVSLEIAGLT